MFKRIIVIMLFVFVNSALSKTINVPTDKSTIQAGINAATDGDTILVQPETYVENINFNGKNIVVASLFLTTRDTSYISQTVIDGDSNGSVVIFENGEDSTAILVGFILQNGLAPGLDEYPPEYNNGGGIHCRSSSPTLIYLVIQNNSAVDGGGIYCGNNANPEIHDVKILNNDADRGGGIGCWDSSPKIYNSTISGNIGRYGAGLCFQGSKAVLNNVLITRNMNGFPVNIYAFMEAT
jgi:predicted outer membrane repeat protein